MYLLLSFLLYFFLNSWCSSIQGCSQDVDCFKVYKAANKFLYKAETIITKLSDIKEVHGNLLAIFSPLIGNSFSKSTVTAEPNCLQALNSNEIQAHQFFSNLTEKIFGKLNYTISIFDIPTLVSAITPRRKLEYTYKDLFPFTLCQQGLPVVNISRNIIRLTDCLLVWHNTVQYRNPFSCVAVNKSYEATGILNKFCIEL